MGRDKKERRWESNKEDNLLAMLKENEEVEERDEGEIKKRG